MRSIEALPITPEMITKNIASWKDDTGESISYEESEIRLNRLADRGCLLYDDCRSCPINGSNCPLR